MATTESKHSEGLKRYSLEETGPAYFRHSEMAEDETGMYVLYDDVAAYPDLVAACKAALASVDHPTAFALDARMTAALDLMRAALAKTASDPVATPHSFSLI